MTVKTLRELLSTDDDPYEVLVTVYLKDYEPEKAEFHIMAVTRTLERDTAEPVVMLECDPAIL